MELTNRIDFSRMPGRRRGAGAVGSSHPWDARDDVLGSVSPTGALRPANLEEISRKGDERREGLAAFPVANCNVYPASGESVEPAVAVLF